VAGPRTNLKKCPRSACGSEDVYSTGGSSEVLVAGRMDTKLPKTLLCRKCDKPFRYTGH